MDDFKELLNKVPHKVSKRLNLNFLSLQESLDENEVSQDGYDSSGEESDVGAEGSASTSTRLSLDDCQSGDSQDGFKLVIKDEDKDDEKVVLGQIVCDPIAIQQMTLTTDKVSETVILTVLKVFIVFVSDVV